MTRQARIGVVTTILTFIGGMWLFFAPFIVGYQKVGQHWVEATRNDLWIGAGLIFFAGLTLLLFIAFALRDAARAAEIRKARREASEGASQEG